MIRLDSINRKLQIALNATVVTDQLSVIASFSDKTTTAYNGSTRVSKTNNTAVVDIVGPPAADVIRDIDYLNVRNNDTAPATITIMYNDNNILYIIIKAVLAAGDCLNYTHGSGWESFNFAVEAKVTNGTALNVVENFNRIVTSSGNVVIDSTTGNVVFIQGV